MAVVLASEMEAVASVAVSMAFTNLTALELHTYVRDTTHAIHLLQNIQFPGPQHVIFTMDVQSLYTYIPHADGLKALRFFLSRRPDQS
eukprot:g16556.t1